MGSSLIILGAGSAIPTADRDNTALALRADGATILIDCPGSVEQKLLRAGIDPVRLDAVVITHTHLDHVYGLPALVHNQLHLGRTTPLPLFVQPLDYERIERLLGVWDLMRLIPFLDLRPLQPTAAAPFWERGGHRLFALEAAHSRPSCAIRWDLPGGHRVVYTSDTRPLPAVAEFARGADLLVHEASYAGSEAARAERDGHATPEQAGRIAALAGARRLLLVHVDRGAEAARWVAEARAAFAGPIEVPAEGAIYEIS